MLHFRASLYSDTPCCQLFALGISLSSESTKGMQNSGLEKRGELKQLHRESKRFAETLKHKVKHLRKFSLFPLSPSFILISISACESCTAFPSPPSHVTTTINSLLYLLHWVNILKLEYQYIVTILGMQQICGSKRMRDMPERSSATRSFICWGSPAEKACSSLHPGEHNLHHCYSKQGKTLQSPSASLWRSFTTELKAV